MIEVRELGFKTPFKTVVNVLSTFPQKRNSFVGVVVLGGGGGR